MTVRLFCIPYAGAGATMFTAWRSALPAFVDLHTPQLPGREERIDDGPFTDFWSAVAWLHSTASAYGGDPIVLFGHSMGAALAFETSRSLAAAGRPPALLAVSGFDAPQHHRPVNHAGPMDDGELRRRVRETGTDPDRLFDDPTLRSLFLPALRADYQLIDGYRFYPGPPLECPVSVWGGHQDPLTRLDRLAGWADHTKAETRLRMVDGGHLFVRDQGAAVISDLAADLAGPPAHS